ncbi:MAG TPA: PilZ domain-containing protein [Thermodesulfovibrionales bacterium]|nr:PilZ domain-containing protein [Thermodesulfovibrionales bacterium]
MSEGKRKSLYHGPQKRRSTRYDKKFLVRLEYEDNVYEVRTIDISCHGVLIPRRSPPPVGTTVKLTLTIRGESSSFEGTIKRHTKCLVNGVQTTAIGIDFSSPEYEAFVKDKIIIS